MSKQEEIMSMERNLAAAKDNKALAQSFNQLTKNRDFRALITKAYMTDEAVRLVHLRGDPQFQTPEKQESIMKQIDAISALSQFFRTVELLAGMAEKSIEETEAMLDELRNGEDE